MGLVLNANRGMIKAYPEETLTWSKALLEPGKAAASVKLAELTPEEVNLILLKLDMLAMNRNNETIAVMITEEIESILLACRMVKAESKQSFMGMLGTGANLDICWLRARHVGGLILNPVATATCGVHGQANIWPTWLFAHTAITATNLIPAQIMKEEAAVIHLGAINPIEVPKVDAIMFYLAGIPTPAQSCEFRVSKQYPQELPVARWEKPIIAGPEKTQRIQIFPYIAGDDKTQLISLLIAQAQDLAL